MICLIEAIILMPDFDSKLSSLDNTGMRGGDNNDKNGIGKKHT